MKKDLLIKKGEYISEHIINGLGHGADHFPYILDFVRFQVFDMQTIGRGRIDAAAATRLIKQQLTAAGHTTTAAARWLMIDSHRGEESVVHVARKQRILELAQIQLEHTRHRIHLTRIHRHQRILALLERLLELVDLQLAAGYSKYALIVQSKSIDGLDAAGYDLRYLLFGHVYVFGELAAEQTRLSDDRRLANLFLLRGLLLLEARIVARLIKELVGTVHASAERLLHHAMPGLEARDQIAARRVLPHLLHVIVLNLDALVLGVRRRVLICQIQIAEQVGHVTIVLDVEEIEQRLFGGLDRLEYLIVLGLERLQTVVELLESLLHLVADERLRVHLRHLVAFVRLELKLFLYVEHVGKVLEILGLVGVRVQVAYAATQAVHGELTRALDVFLCRQVHVDASGYWGMEAKVRTLLKQSILKDN